MFHIAQIRVCAILLTFRAGRNQSWIASVVTVACLVACRPSQAIGIFAGVDVTGDFQRMEIDDRDVAVWSASDESTRTIRLNEDTRCAVSHGDTFDRFTSGAVDDGQVGLT